MQRLHFHSAPARPASAAADHSDHPRRSDFTRRTSPSLAQAGRCGASGDPTSCALPRRPAEAGAFGAPCRVVRSPAARRARPSRPSSFSAEASDAYPMRCLCRSGRVIGGRVIVIGGRVIVIGGEHSAPLAECIEHRSIRSICWRALWSVCAPKRIAALTHTSLVQKHQRSTVY